MMADMETARRQACVFERLGGQSYMNNEVCKFWLAGRCNRNPCRFLHPESQPNQYHRGSNPNPNDNNTWTNPYCMNYSSNQGPVISERKRNTVRVSFPDPDCAKTSSNRGALGSKFKRNEAVSSKLEADSAENLPCQGAAMSERKRNAVRVSAPDPDCAKTSSNQGAVGSKFKRYEAVSSKLEADSAKNLPYQAAAISERKRNAVRVSSPDPDCAKSSSHQGALGSKIKRNEAVSSKLEPDSTENSRYQRAAVSESKRNGAVNFKSEDSDYAKISCNQGAVTSECKRTKAASPKIEDCEIIQRQILTEGTYSVAKNIQICQRWVTGDCGHGDRCKYLHSWFCGSGFSLLAKLEGHKKAVTGIALPSGFDKLLSGSKDESVQLWDCHSGQCVHTVKLSSEVKCLISEGPWVFFGLRNAVRAWNFKTQSELVLDAPNGLVYALATGDDILFAGVEDGSILAWKSNESNCIELVATLKGHSSSVLSLVVGRDRLYSGSKDNTIRVWDVKTLQCLHTLYAHTNSVTSVLCWDNYLLSGSLDNTLKVWAATESGSLEVVYEAREEYGILALSGVKDPQGTPILFCSCKDNAVRLYELPSFSERGRIFSKAEIQRVEVGCNGLFFTGNAMGELFVWRFD